MEAQTSAKPQKLSDKMMPNSKLALYQNDWELIGPLKAPTSGIGIASDNAHSLTPKMWIEGTIMVLSWPSWTL